MGSTNFQQWNPTQANQESDAQYSADSQRTGGAPIGTPFPSSTGNKLFYQLSTFVAAFGQMMANKGYTVSDANLGTLTSVLAGVQTAADLKLPLQTISFSSSITCNAALNSGFEITLGGNTTLNITGSSAGQPLLFVFLQDATGGHTVTFPTGWFGKWQPDPSPNVASAILVYVDNTGHNFLPVGPMMSSSGINGTPIGLSSPLFGGFTVVQANSAGQLNNQGGSLQWNATGGAGETDFVNFRGGGAGGFNWYNLADGATPVGQSPLMNLSPTGLLTLISANITAGGALAGIFSGSPQFSGTPNFQGLPTISGSFSPTDNSNKIPTTNWVQGLLAAMGAGGSLGTNGYFKFGSLLGGLIIQWGISGNVGVGSGSVSFPIAFPNACFAVVSTDNYAGNSRIISVSNISNFGYTVTSDGNNNGQYWIAIGH